MSSKEYAAEQNGVLVASMRESLWRHSGEIVVHGTCLRVNRKGMIKDAFKLESRDAVLVEVTQDKPFRREFSLAYDGRHYEIRRTGRHKRILIVDSNGLVVGSVTHKGFFPGAAFGELPDEWPISVKVFLMWIACVLWDQDHAALMAS